MRLQPICKLLGVLLMVLAAAMATSMPWSFDLGWAGLTRVDAWSTVAAFAASVGITLGCGALLWMIGRNAIDTTIYHKEALFIVGSSWLLLGVFGGLPYLLDGAFTNPADAYFETISGFTTTGSTVLRDIEGLSEALHWWRGMTHWLGGMGVIVLFIAIFPRLGAGGKLLFKSEVPGPITEGLQPKIRETSWSLYRIYTAFTLVLALILYLIGPTREEALASGLSPNAEMDLHNALIHAMATMATGGFSTLNASVAGFDSALIDVVITVFMVFAGVNFSLYYLAQRGGWRRAVRDRELWVYLIFIAAATAVITANIWGTGTPGTPDAEKHTTLLNSLRYAAFQVVGVITTTGFGTDNFDLYPPMSQLILITLMFVGGMAGSTAGGIKVFRIMVVFKAIVQEAKKVVRPASVHVVKISGKPVNREVVTGILAYFALAIFIFAIASLYMTFLGLDIVTATTSVAATFFNIGPGLRLVGPVESFAFIPSSGKMVLSFCMILGRLEFYAILTLIMPDFWKD